MQPRPSKSLEHESAGRRRKTALYRLENPIGRRAGDIIGATRRVDHAAALTGREAVVLLFVSTIRSLRNSSKFV